MTRICWHGHRTPRVGCVSCVLVFDNAPKPALADLPGERTCATCVYAGDRFELQGELQGGGYQVCRHEEMSVVGSSCVPLRDEDGKDFGCTLHQSVALPGTEAPVPTKPSLDRPTLERAIEAVKELWNERRDQIRGAQSLGVSAAIRALEQLRDA